MKKSILALPALAAMAAALTFLAVPANSKSEKFEVRPTGKAVTCVPIRNIRDTDVVDNQTIDFKMAGGKTYRSTLPYSCPSLKFEDSFSYRVSTGQLCNVDIIRVLDNRGGALQEGAGCGLGKFQPIERVRSAR